MLQVSHPTGRSFTKTEIAEMTRGTKAPVKIRSAKPRPDPLIALITKANVALDKYVSAYNAVEEARDKLPEHDRGWASVSPIEKLIPTLSHSDRFVSVEQIDRWFARDKKTALIEIKDARARLRKIRKGVGWHQFELELNQRIAGNKARIARLEKYKLAQKRAFRAEERRLAKVQRTVRLEEKRKTKSAAGKVLSALTKRVTASAPASKAGALALLAYIELRYRGDLANLFQEHGVFDASLPLLISRSRSFLTRCQS